MYVCLFACLSTWISQKHVFFKIVRIFLNMLRAAVAQSLWTTSCFHIVVHRLVAVVIDQQPVTPCLSDTDSPVADSKRFDWEARLSALLWGRGKVK